MEEQIFSEYASGPNNPNWEKHIERGMLLYKRPEDIRSDYERDYTRILHSLAYRRLKHKTQVFFNIDNDHVCTRMEHVQHVESVSCTIAKRIGLNTDLTRAIAMGHDLGHTPFGHEGEVELTKIRSELGMDRFWHERNSLRMIDSLELLEDDRRILKNLDLTYAVRDGIISHCGEVDENGIFPRKEAIDLNQFQESGQYQAYTWEGCVVKIADKIAYLGRDIEDALRVNFIDQKDLEELLAISKKYGHDKINTTVIIHNFITSICANSSPERGICLGENENRLLNEIKKFNYNKIYKNARFKVYQEYVKLIIRSLYDALMETYAGAESFQLLKDKHRKYPKLYDAFWEHINTYAEITDESFDKLERLDNKKLYGHLETKELYAQAIIDYISGMTDRYAIECFNELIHF